MKYRHEFHAGNFADVHKHATLLALIAALQRKDKGFLLIDTHAGRGRYHLQAPIAGRTPPEWLSGAAQLLRGAPSAPELTALRDAIRHESPAAVRAAAGIPTALSYPGSPLLSARALREVDRAVYFENEPGEARALALELESLPRVRIERGDGYEGLRALLPPPERRGLVFIDPPYESRTEYAQVQTAITQVLQRFATATLAVWLPIKQRDDLEVWLARLIPQLPCETLLSALWLRRCDARVALNGSAMLLLNPPFQLEVRMREWLPQLQQLLSTDPAAGCELRVLRSERAPNSAS
jgi:23S rRNA (adenine2030-N6)-methyltransferase